MAVLAAKMSKIEEASKKKDEQANNFILQTREALEQKMETHIEKREAYINDLKSKLKDHVCINYVEDKKCLDDFNIEVFLLILDGFKDPRQTKLYFCHINVVEHGIGNVVVSYTSYYSSKKKN